MNFIEQTAGEIFALYALHGGEDYIGEPVSQLEHMYQMAQLAEEAGYDDEVILAAFFHDIGHLVATTGSYTSHETIGAEYLRRKGFSEKLISLVESHVVAKRYLTYKYPEYLRQLSGASQKTLFIQGGMMTEEEAIAFESDPLFDLKVQFRKWDDEAKITGKSVSGWEKLKAKVIRHLESQSSN
jgi:2-amino-1-hydroxyethylphosphonate dioxygenase (glycine-forming)